MLTWWAVKTAPELHSPQKVFGQRPYRRGVTVWQSRTAQNGNLLLALPVHVNSALTQPKSTCIYIVYTLRTLSHTCRSAPTAHRLFAPPNIWVKFPKQQLQTTKTTKKHTSAYSLLQTSRTPSGWAPVPTPRSVSSCSTCLGKSRRSY